MSSDCDPGPVGDAVGDLLAPRPGFDGETGRALGFGISRAGQPEQPIRFTFGDDDIECLATQRDIAGEEPHGDGVGENKAPH